MKNSIKYYLRDCFYHRNTIHFASFSNESSYMSQSYTKRMVNLYTQNGATMVYEKVNHLLLKWNLDWNHQLACYNLCLLWKAVNQPQFRSTYIFSTDLYAFHVFLLTHESIKPSLWSYDSILFTKLKALLYEKLQTQYFVRKMELYDHETQISFVIVLC